MRPSRLGLPFLVLALTAAVSPRVSACSCSYVPDFDAALKNSQAIFLGEVIEITSAAPEFDHDVWVTFNVETQWKGEAPTTYRLRTPATEALCGVTFQTGSRWLVYALRSAEGTWTHACWRTHTYFAEDPDLKALGAAPVVGSWGSLKVRYR